MPPYMALNGVLQQLCDPATHLNAQRVCSAFQHSHYAKQLQEYPVGEVRTVAAAASLAFVSRAAM